MVVAVESAKEGVMVEEDEVTWLMFADDSVGISGMPEGLQKQTEKAL